MINSKQFGFNFFLSNRTKVTSLQEGAKKYGGATKYNNGIFANIEGSEYIKVNDNNNTLSVFVPSTMEIDTVTDNRKIIEYSINYLKKYYNNANIIYYATNGSWYSDDRQSTIIEDITTISIDMVTVTEKDINIFKQLALYIKETMQQEGVSISINAALAIV